MTVVIYEIDGRRRVRVLLKEGLRPAVYLRSKKKLARREETPWLHVAEIAAGVLEPQDDGDGGVERRAAIEADEELGIHIDANDVRPLGGPMFASPGVTDERVHFRAAQASIQGARGGKGDGSAMEQDQRVRVLEVAEAIELCRTGEIPDMKTEIGLLRLCDKIGFLPQLGMFMDELPPKVRLRRNMLGVEK